MLQKSIFCFSLIQTWGGNKELKLWSFLQPSPTPPGGRQKIMKLGWKAAGGRRSGFFPFWAPLPPNVSREVFVSLACREDPRLLCSRMSEGTQTRKKHKQALHVRRWNKQVQHSMGKSTLHWEPGGIWVPPLLSLYVYVGWSMHPLNLSLLIWSVGIMLLLKSPLFQGWSTNEKVCVRETDAVIDKCLCSLG